MIQLKRIGVGSAFKVGVIAYAILAAIFGLIAFILQASFFSLLFGSANTFSTSSADSSAVTGLAVFSLGALCFGYIIGVVAGALFGGIGTALLAIAYNIAVRWVGGLELEFSDPTAVDEIVADLRGL